MMSGNVIYFIDYAADGLPRFNGKQPIPEHRVRSWAGSFIKVNLYSALLDLS
jgi:hypothetical protein